jgi:hypothetical protein
MQVVPFPGSQARKEENTNNRPSLSNISSSGWGHGLGPGCRIKQLGWVYECTGILRAPTPFSVFLPSPEHCPSLHKLWHCHLCLHDHCHCPDNSTATVQSQFITVILVKSLLLPASLTQQDRAGHHVFNNKDTCRTAAWIMLSLLTGHYILKALCELSHL